MEITYFLLYLILKVLSIIIIHILKISSKTGILSAAIPRAISESFCRMRKDPPVGEKAFLRWLFLCFVSVSKWSLRRRRFLILPQPHGKPIQRFFADPLISDPLFSCASLREQYFHVQGEYKPKKRSPKALRAGRVPKKRFLCLCGPIIDHAHHRKPEKRLFSRRLFGIMHTRWFYANVKYVFRYYYQNV